MKFNPDNLATALQSMPPCDSVLLGFSGGVDSIALLHALQSLRVDSQVSFAPRAIHVHHGLQVEADRWQAFCEAFCDAHQIPLQVAVVHVGIGEPGNKAGLENAARNARYQAFETNLQQGEALLLAHHLDDQLETFLLRLMRGAGTRGLSAMPHYRLLRKSFLFRPLLAFSRESIEAYAREQDLQWIEDGSNADIHFDRNYCRHELMPLIQQRWPEYRDSWSKSLTLIGEAEGLLSELAEIDLQCVVSERTDRCDAIDVERLKQLSEVRQRNVLRFWLAGLGFNEIGWNRLQQLSREIISARGDTQAVLSLDGFRLRRFRNDLCAIRDLPAPQQSQSMEWQTGKDPSLQLPDNGRLLAASQLGAGLRAEMGNSLQVRYRRGGETCQMVGRPTKSLKKLLQEHEVAPWLRDRIPLIYAGDELVCIPGIGVAACQAAHADEPGLTISWESPQFPITD